MIYYEGKLTTEAALRLQGYVNILPERLPSEARELWEFVPTATAWRRLSPETDEYEYLIARVVAFAAR